MTETIDPDDVADAIHARSRTYGDRGALVAEEARLRDKLIVEGKILPIDPFRRY